VALLSIEKRVSSLTRPSFIIRVFGWGVPFGLPTPAHSGCNFRASIYSYGSNERVPTPSGSSFRKACGLGETGHFWVIRIFRCGRVAELTLLGRFLNFITTHGSNQFILREKKDVVDNNILPKRRSTVRLAGRNSEKGGLALCNALWRV
jgi:hypothetical protein